MTPEFSRIVAVETIGDTPRDLHVEADETERRRLAGRFGWATVERLDADVRLVAQAGGIAASGQLHAVLNQKCVATGEPVHEAVSMPFVVRFVETSMLGAGEDEVELADDDLDVVEFSGGAIDVGEAVAQTLALCVEPFPRCPDAQERLRAAGVGEADPARTGPLAGLKDLL